MLKYVDQTMEFGIRLFLANINTRSWLDFTIKIYNYDLEKFPWAGKKELELLTRIFKRHNPHHIVK